jgi:hypothetical protein
MELGSRGSVASLLERDDCGVDFRRLGGALPLFGAISVLFDFGTSGGRLIPFPLGGADPTEFDRAFNISSSADRPSNGMTVDEGALCFVCFIDRAPSALGSATGALIRVSREPSRYSRHTAARSFISEMNSIKSEMDRSPSDPVKANTNGLLKDGLTKKHLRGRREDDICCDYEE